MKVGSIKSQNRGELSISFGHRNQIDGLNLIVPFQERVSMHERNPSDDLITLNESNSQSKVDEAHKESTVHIHNSNHD